MTQLLRRLWAFLMSIKFGVFLIVTLMVTMMIATQFEASTSTRAMKHYIYGSKWFDAAVFLFVVNIVVNTFRRRPWGFRHTGFLTVHAGVLTCVAGGLTSRYFAVDGSMPIEEGGMSREISLPENDLIVEAGGRTAHHATHYDLKPWETEHADLYEVPGMPYRLRVDRYYPTGAIADTLLQDPERGVPTLRLAVGVAGHEPSAAWLRVGDPEHREVAHGSVRIRVASSSEAEAIRREWKAAPASKSTSAGKLTLFWRNGASETFDVPVRPGASLNTSVPGVRVEVVQVFRAFMLAEGGAVDASDKPENPAIRFRVVRPDGREEHLAFTKFPEFRVDPPEGETWLATHGAWEPGAGGFAREIVLEHAGEGRWLPWTSWGDRGDGAALDRDETRELADAGVLLRVLEESDHGVLARVVVKESDEVRRPALLVRLVEEAEAGPARAAFLGALRRGAWERADADPSEVWLFHGESFRFETPSGPLDVHFRTRSIPLDFAIQLDDFREETYPGTSLASSYESHVTVQPSGAEPFNEKIYMNHPLKYAGYVFYQASFQRTPEGEVTILSVARDPGMTISFVGYCILVGGLLLIFFAKPYLRKLDDRRAIRSANTGG
jgi:hypothetical protein